MKGRAEQKQLKAPITKKLRFHVNKRAIFKYIGSLVFSGGFLLKHCWWIMDQLGFLKV
jgi:hypothetical protein